MNSPPDRPTICRGEVSATSVQPSEPKPLPKNARAIRPITALSLSTWMLSTMQLASSMPTTMGSLRARVRE
ncbi:hypothetical protein D9M68_941340 [compost metagenome]